MEKTIQEYSLILKIDPGNFWATLGIGNYYLYEINQLTKAELYLKRAIQLDPDQWFPYSSLADLYERRDDPITAASMRERVHQLKQGKYHPSNTPL